MAKDHKNANQIVFLFAIVYVSSSSSAPCGTGGSPATCTCGTGGTCTIGIQFCNSGGNTCISCSNTCGGVPKIYPYAGEPCSDTSDIQCKCKAGQEVSTYITSGKTYCQPSPGYYNSSSQQDFIPCPAGTWSVYSGYGPQGQGSSMNESIACAGRCPPGTYGDKSGQSSQATACSLCSIGTFSNSSGSSKCTQCPLGSYGFTQGATSESSGCVKCDAGSYNSVAGASFCIDCPKGRFNNKTGAVSVNACEKCPIGYYAFGTSNTYCSPCPMGTYADNPGTFDCVSCPTGTYGTSIGATSNATCQSCPAGTFNPSPGQTFSGCTPCPSGTYSSKIAAKSLSDCSACPKGQYIDNVGQSACAGCAYGLQPAPGSLSSYDSITSKCVALVCDTLGIQINGSATSCSGCPTGFAGLPTNCKVCKPDQTCPGLLSTPLLNGVRLLPEATDSQHISTASLSWIAYYRALEIAAIKASKRSNLLSEDSYFTIVFGAFAAFMAMIISTYVVALKVSNHTLITAGSVEHQREISSLISSSSSSSSSSSTSSNSSSEQKTSQPPTSPSFHHRFLIALGMSDRFSAAHFTPPGEIVRMTPTALGGILTIAGFGVIVILAIQLVINYFSESTNTLVSTSYVLTGQDSRSFQWNTATLTSSSVPISNDWRSSSSSTTTTGSTSIIQGLMVRLIVQGEPSGECAKPLAYSPPTSSSSISSSYVSMKPMTWTQPNALGPISNTSSVFSYIATGTARKADGISEHVFACKECNLAFANKLVIALHWTCQSIAVELASVPEVDLITVVNATSYRPGAPIESLGRLTSLTWMFSSILPTVVTNAYYSNKPITIFRGFRLGSGSVSYTQARDATVQPASATVLVTLELPENDFREEVSITAKLNGTQLVSSILGLLGALSIFRILMKVTEMGHTTIEKRRAQRKGQNQAKVQPLTETAFIPSAYPSQTQQQQVILGNNVQTDEKKSSWQEVKLDNGTFVSPPNTLYMMESRSSSFSDGESKEKGGDRNQGAIQIE